MDTGHDTDIDTPTPLVISENHIIQCNYVSVSDTCPSFIAHHAIFIELHMNNGTDYSKENHSHSKIDYHTCI